MRVPHQTGPPPRNVFAAAVCGIIAAAATNGSEHGKAMNLLRTLPRLLVIVSLVVFCAAAVGLSRGPGMRAFAQEANKSDYDQQIAAGHDFMRQRRYDEALKAFKRANELKNQNSAEALFLMANAYMGLEAYKAVANTCDKVIELSPNDAARQAQAYNLKGIAIQKQSEGKDQKKLQEAEAVLRQAAALKEATPDVHYNLGIVLMQENRDAEGAAELKEFLRLSPNAFNAADTRKMIDNPRRAREPFAPDFSITTAAGENISLNELKGKIVLLDFWGTWCGPCVASVPGLRDLNKKFTKESSFVMISVSSDGDEDKWKDFIVKEKMVWVQYLDREHKVQRAFRVDRFPTYILLDHEGVIRYRSSGMGLDKEALLEDAVKKQIKLVAKPAN
jgi:tetratricopeptide (TPR) repeat protein